MNCKLLLEKFEKEAKEAIFHPFLESIKKDELKNEKFNIWLEQDYLFVWEFVRLLGSLLVDAPTHHMSLIIGGLNAIKNELSWFEKELNQRNLTLMIKIHENCKEYIDFLQIMMKSSYAVKIVSVFLIEFVYQNAWNLGDFKGSYVEAAQRWSNEEFSSYVKELESKANEILQCVGKLELIEIENAFKSILILEKKFWDMGCL